MPAAFGFKNSRLTGTDRKSTIGRIVAISLAFGFVAALVLVLMPFGGAPEHAITGAALLGFGAGWGLLAFRAASHGQPQRWAAVAAIAFLSFAGCLFLWPRVVASAWFWPAWLFFLIVLAIWIAVGARRHLNNWSRPWLIYPIAGVMLAGAIAGLYEAARESSDRTPMRGDLVDVGGRRLHLRCSGSGDPVVVLVPGAGEFSAVWGWIEPEVAGITRVCVYDMAGRGWSDAAPAAQDGVAIAEDLHALLEHARVSGPYVLVGHSFGGLYVRSFAAKYAQEVAGMVLLDSTSPEMFTRVRPYPRVYESYRRVSALFPSLARFGIGRLAYRNAFDSLPQRSRDEQLAFWPTP
ncbi:MAG TPA: alpha/beta hydrolase, partial [Gemmatimonadaceae bacterium]